MIYNKIKNYGGGGGNVKFPRRFPKSLRNEKKEIPHSPFSLHSKFGDLLGHLLITA